MKTRPRSTLPRRAFTLVELLVVVSIIAILIAVLLPAMGRVRENARVVQTSAALQSLEQGIQQFRGDPAVGGVFPPSAGDDPTDTHMIADPLSQTAAQKPQTPVCGAHLLVHALVGADLLGTPGFRDLDRDGRWSDDTHSGKGGAYELDNDGTEVQPRYGGAGFVGPKMKEENISTLGELEDAGNIVNWADGNVSTAATRNQPLFVDPWDHPILYYKANPAARLMISTGESAGIFSQEDNGIITGSQNGSKTYTGIDFGGGWIDDQSTVYHQIADAVAPLPQEDVNDDKFAYSFARFIHDPTIKARNTPVRRDAFLLISAGPDFIYGTDDDVTNWTR